MPRLKNSSQVTSHDEKLRSNDSALPFTLLLWLLVQVYNNKHSPWRQSNNLAASTEKSPIKMCHDWKTPVKWQVMTKNSDQMTLHCPLPYKTYISHTYLYFWSSICARKASLAAATLVFLASRPILAAYLFLVTFFSVLALGDGSEQMAASANQRQFREVWFYKDNEL